MHSGRVDAARGAGNCASNHVWPEVEEGFEGRGELREYRVRPEAEEGFKGEGTARSASVVPRPGLSRPAAEKGPTLGWRDGVRPLPAGAIHPAPPLCISAPRP
ncbi:hypothetical protein GCM10010289_20130 [Streptomyces violascens]|uniref:Uncharacterized protein n=1 Tax=Streptomyces violascens TaxID=67381 RepID=A0ABQ3QMG1_9ACTN|nr:hypothetical protein GCM10010289_20130 [Streptomyces violascens]GHI38457.1 hypothetical protein Sviol_28650 [Streptomyces violascens]